MGYMCAPPIRKALVALYGRPLSDPTAEWSLSQTHEPHRPRPQPSPSTSLVAATPVHRLYRMAATISTGARILWTNETSPLAGPFLKPLVPPAPSPVLRHGPTEQALQQLLCRRSLFVLEEVHDL